MLRPGVIVIVGQGNKTSRNGAVATFVNGLTSGELDGIEHEIYTIPGKNGERLHYEIIA
jgi:hypothetical protein